MPAHVTNPKPRSASKLCWTFVIVDILVLVQALVKYLDNVSDEDIPSLEIPTGVPLIYELDDDLKPIRHYYVG